MGILTREAILAAASDLRTKVVAVPEWGGDVVVGEMSGTDRDDWDAEWIRRIEAEKAAAKKDGRPVDERAASLDYEARMVAWTARDGEGKDLFAVRRADGRIDVPATEAVAKALARKGAGVLKRLCTAAEAVNAVGAEAIKAAEGNSGGTSGV